MAKKPMTDSAARRIQGAEGKKTGGHTPKGTFTPRAQRAAANNRKK